MDDTGKLKHNGWDWYENTWELVMKSLNEGYQRLDSIITENHLEEGFDDDLENFIRK